MIPRRRAFDALLAGGALLFALTSTSPASAARAAKSAPAKASAASPVPRWLILGPAADVLPVFHDDAPFAYGLRELLGDDRFARDADPPVADSSVAWPGGATLRWRATDAKGGEVSLPRGAAEGPPQVARLAAYVSAACFTACDLVEPDRATTKTK